MSEQRPASPEAVAINAARAGVPADAATAERISRAISPALAAFDLASLRLPMPEEPSGWSARAEEGRRA